MVGIDLNRPVTCTCASFKYFRKKEHHITRFCQDNALLLVFDGILRFSEDGEEVEVRAGEYYIQRNNCHQAGAIVSDEPKYLYAHFDAEWVDSPDALPFRGHFNPALLFDTMTEIDYLSHRNAPYCDLQYIFLKLLLSLKQKPQKNPLAEKISKYIEENIEKEISLGDICEVFHFSKNYIIRIFNNEFGKSPIQYINEIKLNRAMYLLETTSKSITEIATECGYTDYSYFYKRFIKMTGINPKEWRNNVQKNPLCR